mgnify:CR=1 FL=1
MLFRMSKSADFSDPVKAMPQTLSAKLDHNIDMYLWVECLV